LLGGDIHTPVLITDNLIYGSTYSGFEIHGSGSMTGLVVNGLIIYNPGTYGIEIREGAGGSGVFSNVVVINPGGGGLGSNIPYSFTINRGSGNSGW
jgi:hypothetical protein